MNTFTVTGKSGAGLTMTAQVFNDVRSFNFDASTEVLQLRQDGLPDTFIDISAATTWTVTITAPNTYVHVIS
jgi:hypothetical protein